MFVDERSNVVTSERIEIARSSVNKTRASADCGGGHSHRAVCLAEESDYNCCLLITMTMMISDRSDTLTEELMDAIDLYSSICNYRIDLLAF